MNTIIAVDTTQVSPEYFESLKKMDFLKESNLHFVHAVKEYYNGYDIFMSAEIMLEQDKKIVEEAVVRQLKDLAAQVLPYEFKGQVSYHCIFGFDPLTDLVKFTGEQKADLLVIVTRPEHSFIDDSFAYHCGLHAPCDVLVVRGHDHDIFKGRMKVTAGMKVDTDSFSKFSLKKYPFLNKAHIDFIHVSPKSRFSIDIYPKAERELVICDVVTKKISQHTRNMTPENFEGSVETNCEFSNNAKKCFADHVNKSESDLLVLLQKEKLFGNFYHYQLTHTNANVLVLRDRA